MIFAYPAVIEQEKDNVVVVVLKNLPCKAEGPTSKEALRNARLVLEEHIKFCITHDVDLPEPANIQTDEYAILLDAHIAAKTALYIAFKKAGYSKSDLARKMKVDNKEVRRMLSFQSPTKLPRIIEALSILGYRLSVSLSPVM